MGKIPRGLGRLPSTHKGPAQSIKVSKDLQRSVHKVKTAATAIFARLYLDKRGQRRSIDAQKAPPTESKAAVKHARRAYATSKSTLEKF